jgi:hypothetical protein
MAVDQLPAEDRSLPKLLREAERRVNARVFRTGGDDSLASIPANRDRDVDLLLIEAADEIERWQKLYEMAVRGRQEFRQLCREMRERLEKIP